MTNKTSEAEGQFEDYSKSGPDIDETLGEEGEDQDVLRERKSA